MNAHQKKVIADEVARQLEKAKDHNLTPAPLPDTKPNDSKGFLRRRGAVLAYTSFLLCTALGYLTLAGLIDMGTALAFLIATWAIGALGIFDLLWTNGTMGRRRLAFTLFIAFSVGLRVLHLFVMRWRTTQAMNKAQEETYCNAPL
jgi:hypothetical protein